jgi:hypothetical protein
MKFVKKHLFVDEVPKVQPIKTFFEILDQIRFRSDFFGAGPDQISDQIFSLFRIRSDFLDHIIADLGSDQIQIRFEKSQPRKTLIEITF